MATPIVVPLTIGGALLAYWGQRRSTVACLLLPATLVFDVTAKPPVYSVTTKMVVNAAPERVWRYVVAFPDIAAKPDWQLSTGVAYPIRTRIEGTGVGAPRDCDLSTGIVKEFVTAWDEPRLLRFVVTATPPSMKETGLYGPRECKAFEWILHREAGPVRTDPASRRTHAGHGNVLVSAWLVASRVLALVVRRGGASCTPPCLGADSPSVGIPPLSRFSAARKHGPA